MYETSDDLDRLQRLLDDSHAAAEPHHRSIFDDAHRVGASDLAAMLPGVQVLCVATVSARCEPRVAPVDGLFYRGRWHFGSSADSVKFRHLRRRPVVSAAHVRGEEFAVIVHGRARELDVSDPEHRGLKDYLFEVYGNAWAGWAAGVPYAVIEADRMYTRLWVHAGSGAG